MASNVVGVGGDLQFNRYTISEANWTRIRAMARVAFHFAVRRAFDPYFAVSGGLRIESFSDDPHYFVGPAARLALGTRFFFTPNIGAFAELGFFGGGLFHVGLSAKLK